MKKKRDCWWILSAREHEDLREGENRENGEHGNLKTVKQAKLERKRKQLKD